MNIAKNLERARIFFPEKPALIFEGKTWSYIQLDTDVNRMANGLLELGVHKGDRVALFLPNIPEFVIGYFAIQKIGAIAVSVNAMLKSEEVKYIINDAEARVILTTALLRQEIPADALPSVEHIIVSEGDAGNDLSFDHLLSRCSGQCRCLDLDIHDPAAILYTSGTTGFPKGAVLTQYNIVSNSRSASNHSGVRPEDCLQLFLPLFHCFGQNYILNGGICKCATIALHRRFEPEPVLNAIQKERISMFFAVPTVFIYLLNMDTSRYDLTSMRYCFTAAANMPRETALAWKDKFNLVVNEGYGLTECSPFASYNHDFKHKFGSIGTPIENVDMKIADDNGNTLPPGEMGEIVIRGPNVMQGYWRKPEATAAAIQNGWLRSGDIGIMDEEGYFFITDRVKDMINVAGFNVYPNEVEQVIYRHPAIQEAAVYGVSDPVKGEAVHAAVVLKENMVSTPEEIIKFCRDNMAVYRIPKKVDFVKELPKSPTGKILKRVLRGDS
ncbi:MAG: long-chain fatty acid--CoA ligase [Desulfatirhabdiaceae bacterium]